VGILVLRKKNKLLRFYRNFSSGENVMADSVKRPKTPAGTAINHDVYDEAVDADDEDFDQELDIGDEQHPSLDSNITLESVHTSLIRAAGAAGAVAGAGGLFSDDVTLESVQAGPYHYEDKPFGPPQEYRTISEMAIRQSDDSIVRESIFQGHTGIAPAGWRLKSEPGSEYGEDDDTDEDKERTTPESQEQGHVYDPGMYDALPVSPLIKDLFPMIMEYEPKTIRMDYKLMPFIPDLIPAIGDVDAFIKIPRPDKKQDPLGLGVLDEPSCGQTDPQLLDLKLRALAKGATTGSAMDVKNLPDADDATAINEWMDNVDSLHREKPPTKVYYSNPMPEIDQLMQAWPPAMEKRLNSHPPKLPGAKSLEEAVDVACNILDIPVHKEEPNGRIQSLHLMMSLYLEFKRSQHFGTKIDI